MRVLFPDWFQGARECAKRDGDIRQINQYQIEKIVAC